MVSTLTERRRPTPATFDGEQVRRFYDDNTRLFLSLGQGTEGTIHRAIWGPGVRNRVEAMAYVDELVIERLARLMPLGGETPRVVDLGSGVCASLCRIAKRRPIEGVGVTISPRQVEIATQRIEALGLSDRVRSLCADFCALPPELPSADLAFAVESFVHASSGAAFFEQAARLLRPGGLLIICDDWIAEPALRSDARASRWIQRFRQGWRAGSVLSGVEAQPLASAAGLRHVETVDLTPHLEIRRPRDYAMGALMRCFGWLPIQSSYWSMLYGGHALQIGLKRGWIKHELRVWEKQ